jgi:3-hydroxymyristoyl/3-hydroxydecanoyl-(acyl carrier protein) dehydratase
MFVSRVTDIDAAFGELKPSMIEIEYDIPQDAWYAARGKVPFSILNESAHCGILLLSFMGVDLLFKGRRHYRAIDSTVKIHSEKMLKTGQTVKGRYKIVSFIKTREQMLAIFTYDLFDADHLHILTLKGTGGFFSRDDLTKSKGIQPPEPDVRQGDSKKAAFSPILACNKTVFSRQDILHLQNGRADLCFGRSYPVYDSGEHLYPKQFRMLDRVSRIDATGGRFGLGLLIGEADIDPNHWIFNAHFKDDPVLPATFMIEGGIQLLSFYFHFLGLKKLAGPDSAFNMVSGSESRAKFRGEVKREKTTLRYECNVKQIRIEPEVTIIADVIVLNADRMVAQTENMCMEFKEQKKPHSSSLWQTDSGNVAVLEEMDILLKDESRTFQRPKVASGNP